MVPVARGGRWREKGRLNFLYSYSSLRLHTRHGFHLVGVEREAGFKFERWQDVVLMQCMLHTEAPPPSPAQQP